MRDHPSEVTLALTGSRWSYLVDAIQRRRAEHVSQMRAATTAGNEMAAGIALDGVQALNEVLAIIDPVGESQEIEFWAER